MKKFMDYTRADWLGKFQPRAKKYWYLSIGTIAVAMAMYFIGAYAGILAMIVVAYIFGIITMVLTLALMLATAYWYMDRYSEYRKVR